ncbi:MAG TPA: hypothetical protein VK548_02770 [Candidatus Acidoferrum sp.]|nr:hypothetical protein [Candidatus Acidoferrum sp.]
MATVSYVRVHTAGSIVKSAFAIFARHFGVLFLTVLIFQAPIIAAQVLSVGEAPVFWMLILVSAIIIVIFLSVAPLTVLIADICLGAAPDLGRAFRRAFGTLTGRVVRTVLLVWVTLAVGFLLLVVPIMIFATWYMLALCVVVLERTSPRASLRRSKLLGKGFYLRNLGVLVLMSVITFVSAAIVGAVVSAVGGAIGLPLRLIVLIGGVIGAACAVPGSIAPILLYYDMRCRKEGYDTRRLAEDLSH